MERTTAHGGVEIESVQARDDATGHAQLAHPS